MTSNKEKLDKLGRFEGSTVYLRPFTMADVTADYMSWLADPNVNRYLETVTDNISEEDAQAFCSACITSDSEMLFAIMHREDDTHIGNIKLGGINWQHSYADLGVLLGHPNYRGKGYGKEACRLLLECAFHGLELNKVILGVHCEHRKAIGLYESLGFKTEGTSRKLLREDKHFVDKIWMGILREEFLDNVTP